MTGGEDVQQTTTTSERKWTKWKTLSIVYAISLLLYAILCLKYGLTEMRIELGTLIFPITLAFFALFWSIDEARKETTEQIESLQKQTVKQINALKDSTKLQSRAYKNRQ